MRWTDERKEILKKLWAEGLSASMIASRLGGVTRNSVISKVHRLGLSGRTTTKRLAQSRGGKMGAKRVRAQQRAAAAAAKPQSALQRAFAAGPEPFEPRPALEVPMSQRKVLDDLNPGDCRFPYGDGPFTFCVRPKVDGLSYCADHAQICFQPPAISRRPSASPARSLRIVAGTDVDGGGHQGSQQDEIPASGAQKAKEAV